MAKSPSASAKIILLFLILTCEVPMSFAQNNAPSWRNKPAKWPYTGHRSPPYIAVVGGYEGFKTHNIEAGIGLNALDLDISAPIGGMLGGGLFYKQRTGSAKIYSYEAEVGIYSGIVLGLNYNHNVVPGKSISGFKPFVGIAVYNFQVFYGYSFYHSKSDLSNALRHNRISLRYVIPVIRIKK